jgi:hypothetical protein
MEEDTPLEDLLENFKSRSIEKNIEIYYLEKTIKETIIQEAPKEEYLEHLLQALKDSLKKGKKTGKIRRVEKDLVEIDKGAVHKVRERDIYKVYDSSSGAYKGKIEIQAIADAVSIGQNYNLKGSSLNVNDTIKFLGNRKYMEFGLQTGIQSIGLVWRYNMFGGWGFEFMFASSRIDRTVNSIELTYRINHSFGARKYFNFPSLYCPYIGIGVVSKVSVNFNTEYNNLPYLTFGAQLFSCRALHLDLELRYLAFPEFNIGSISIKDYPLIFLTSFCMSW